MRIMRFAGMGAVCMLMALAAGKLMAQAPQKFNYQAVVRNSSGNPVPSGTTVAFRFSLSQNRAFGTLLYQETQQKTTSGNTGLVNLEIGAGNKTFGSFPSGTQLGSDSLFLKVEMDPAGGSAYFEVSVVQLVSVPYAIYASSAGHAADAWSQSGNNGTDSVANFIGTTDQRGLLFKTNNASRIKITATGLVGIGTITPTRLLTVNDEALIDGLTVGRGNGSYFSNTALGSAALAAVNANGGNTALGYQAMRVNNSGYYNTAVGSSTMSSNTSGHENTGVGSAVLNSNISGSHNTGVGYYALNDNTFGYSNVAVGHSALFRNLDRSNLVAIGDSALYNNGKAATAAFHSTGNAAVGSKALYSNTTGAYNSALGFQALYSNTTGNSNSAFGNHSLHLNSTGSYNSAFGYEALYYNTTGTYNASFGYRSLQDNTTGTYNTAMGYGALLSSDVGIGNTGFGYGALNLNLTGDYNTGLGFLATVNSGSLRHATAIGASALVTTSRTMAFGRADSVTHWVFGRNSYASSSYALQVGTNTSSGNGAYLTTGGAWTNTSDVNLKTDITPVNGEELLTRIKQLEITRWRYDGTNEYHIGPMAQQFYQLFQTGVDDKGISTIDPAGVALKGIQEQQKQIEQLRYENEQLRIRLEKLEQKQAAAGN